MLITAQFCGALVYIAMWMNLINERSCIGNPVETENDFGDVWV